MRIYKYYKINNHLLDALRGDYLWFSAPCTFNDPFDCNANLLSFYPGVWSRDYHYQQNVLSKIEESPKGFEVYMQTVVDQLFENYGICCFSKKNDDVLLWSHYAEMHRGVCLGFESALDPDTFDGFDVRYTNDFRSVDYFINPRKAFNHLILTKAKAWEYEAEYRLFRDSKGKVNYDRNALTEVHFGWKCPIDRQRAVCEILNEKGQLQALDMYRAVPRQNSFSLVSVPVRHYP